MWVVRIKGNTFTRGVVNRDLVYKIYVLPLNDDFCQETFLRNFISFVSFLNKDRRVTVHIYFLKIDTTVGFTYVDILCSSKPIKFSMYGEKTPCYWSPSTSVTCVFSVKDYNRWRYSVVQKIFILLILKNINNGFLCYLLSIYVISFF